VFFAAFLIIGQENSTKNSEKMPYIPKREYIGKKSVKPDPFSQARYLHRAKK